MRWLYKIIFFKILGWSLNGTVDPAIKKCVFIVAPHTSWFDFYLGLLIRKILNIEINFVGKKELFKPPFGWYFRWVGGASLDRTPGQDKVEAIAAVFPTKEIFRLALSPEGTREKVDNWRSGFYYIAQKANVPIIKVAFDYGRKEIKIAAPVFYNKTFEEDILEIEKFYAGVTGKYPDKF
ncbi:1-acyl-sn-glycerol-3-phosphate acyltransferase [Gillisia sp. Hel_I_29]|uniref:1-acyl-sn-glycerol-3-phosphate acyltransferase n=1 Tax=Gillisia sp. Hel_I_29 TaxID=1249975 RepID=UPI0005507728|nr:1-acyl-sn-glycerol-3-phosphate acyltransferase [Gillisia sp. Hel_I_29]